MRFCGSCGSLARHAQSVARDLRGRECPRWGTVHRGCCATAVCSETDARGHVRCAWARGGKERAALEDARPRAEGEAGAAGGP